LKRKALTEKMIVLGVDGFEPKTAKRLMDEGKMPNLKKFVEKGTCREDLSLLGGVPTVTPPLWTTLATGAYPSTHGITCFFGHNHGQLDSLVYNLDSRRSKAEPLWNVFAESGTKTMVWHWPGSAWPPTSDNPNLHVVDGAQPSTVNSGVAVCDMLKIVVASEELNELQFLPNTTTLPKGMGCIIENVDDIAEEELKTNAFKDALGKGHAIKNIITCAEENEIHTLGQMVADSIKSPIKEASGWNDAPVDAKEFTIILGKGVERRPALLLKNEQGDYDTVAVYKSKKETKPLVSIKAGSSVFSVIDTLKNDKGENLQTNRNYHVLDIKPDGSTLTMIIDMAMDMSKDDMFHPKSLFKEVVENIGPPPSRPGTSAKNPKLAEKVIIPTYDYYCQWQADVLTYFMDNNSYDVIYSHIHNIDGAGHFFWHYAKHQEEWGNDEEIYLKFIEDMYVQTDNYLGRFLPYVDKGWTTIITSDHGLLIQEYHAKELGEIGGITTPVMEELGYTTLVRDADGNRTHEIDWANTKAMCSRGDYIYINLKGRDEHGIVDPKDKYDLETQIISDLYNYRDPVTGKRIVYCAMRNKDAAILGMDGPETGDIIFFIEEGFTCIHANSLSTQEGYAGSSVSPILVVAGPGIKQGYTNRVIRQVDIAPTMAFLGGVRLPDQNEGAVVHQILTEEI